MIDGETYGKLWKYCREERLEVIGDIHTHPGLGLQSLTDKRNPMIGNPGHIAIIVPDFAEGEVELRELGIYEYLGNHRWKTWSGISANSFLYIGIFG
jgi:proteasome lid subunit RPN8/RPN11